MEFLVNNNNTVSTFATIWEQNSNTRNASQSQEPVTKQEDSVQISNFAQNATLLSDEEADQTLQETVSFIQEDPYAAMQVHSGLDASRVAALLA